METWNIFIASDLPGCVRIALEGLWGYWLTYRKLSELSTSIDSEPPPILRKLREEQLLFLVVK
jgi:hypothetical protein